MKKTGNKQNKVLFFVVAFLIAVFLCVVLVCLRGVLIIKPATASYNEEVINFNEKANRYNELVNKVSVDNIDGLPTHIENLSVVDNGLVANIKVLFSSNSEQKIFADSETVHETADYIDGLIPVIEQITTPSADWVADRLGKIDSITGTEKVTKGHDPDELLGKEGSYTDCVYFTVKMIDPSEVEGKTIVDKGTDAGGAVEVYSSLEDAKNRCEYLSGFDGTVLYSGSYALVGTMVVRTSYKLSNEDQLSLTNAITEAFTTI